MAAVVVGSNWCKLLLVLLLLVTPIFAAGTIETSPNTRITFLDLEGKDGVIYANLTYTSIEADISQNLENLSEALKLAREGDQEGSQALLEHSGLEEFSSYAESIETQPIPNAPLYFYFYDYVKEGNEYVHYRVDIAGCDPVLTDEFGGATCPIPKNEQTYEGRCIEVIGSYGDSSQGAFQDGENYKYVQNNLFICDSNTTALSNMSDAIKTMLLGNYGNPLCLLSIVMAGMLLASMFFAGRSPLALLDLTTPLLPKAKSISYSGLRMGTGFGRMGKGMAQMADAVNSSAKETTERLLRKLRKKPGYSKGLVNKIMESGASEVSKMLAMRALLAGKDRKFIEGILELDADLKAQGLNDANMDKYAKLLKELKEASDARDLDAQEDNLHELTMNLAEQSIYLGMTMKNLSDATGQVPGKLKSALTYKIGVVPVGPGSLPFIGTHVMGGTASLFMGARHVKRFYSNFARGLTRVGLDAVSPKGDKYTRRIQMAVDDARDKGQKPGMFANWLALSEKEKQLVRIFDNYEYGSNLYKRMMKSAKEDIVNWILGQALKKFGAKSDLSVEEVANIGMPKRDKNGKIIGYYTPEELLFADMTEEQKATYRQFEKKLRDILSNGKLDELQKAQMLLRLFKKQNIEISDVAGVTCAIHKLHDIENRDPTDFNFDPTYDYGGRLDTIKNSYRLTDLNNYLRNEFKIDQTGGHLDTNKFYFTAGRPSLAFKNVDLTFGTILRDNYRKSLSERSSTLGIGEVANYAFARVLNENWGLFDPTKVTGDLKIAMLNAQKWLQSLVNPDSKFFADFKDVKQIPMDKLIQGLRSPSGRPGDDQLAMMDLGPEHVGAVAGAWRINMGAHWKVLGGVMGGAKATVQQQAHGEVQLAHTVPQMVQEMMNREGLSYEQAKEKYKQMVVVPNHLFTRLRGIIEVDKPNTYYTFGGEYKRFQEQNAAYKARIFENPDLLRASVREAFNKENFKNYRNVKDKYLEAFIKKPLSLGDVAQGTWIRLEEGGWVPFVQKHAFSVAQSDRVVNTKTFIRRGGHWEEFAPEKFSGSGWQELFGRDNKVKRWLFGETDYTMTKEEDKIKAVNPTLLKQYKGVLADFESVNAKRRAGISDAKTAVSAKDLTAILQQIDLASKKDPKKAGAYAAMAAKLLSNESIIADIKVQVKVIENGQVKYKEKNATREGLLNTYTSQGKSFEDKIKFAHWMQDYEEAIRDYARARDNTQEKFILGQKREALAKELNSWAKQGAPGEERQVKLAMFFYQHAQRNKDWKDFNSMDAIKIGTNAMHIPGESSNNLQYEQVGGIKGWIKRGFDPLKNAISPYLKTANLGLEQFVLSTFGKQMQAEYETTMTSEYLRETAGKFAANLAAGKYGDVTSRNNAAMNEYNKLADAYTRFHAIWDETITRDPRGNSSAIGMNSIYASFFHHGPAMPFGPAPYRRFTYPGYKTPWTTWSGFKANMSDAFMGLTHTPVIFNYALGAPFGIAYRTYITSRWGSPTKYDRQYKPELYEQYANYQLVLDDYYAKINKRTNELISNNMSPKAARDMAEQEYRGTKPEAPAFELARNGLAPFAQTKARSGEANAALLNWAYSAFDPTSTSWSRVGAALVSAPLALTQFLPIRPVQAWILNKGTPLINRQDKNPYYVDPGGLRSQMIKHAGPMVKRQYGGTEIATGVVRSHEDMWRYQAGVQAVWGNGNPGVSYVDFSGSLQYNPRAANYMRYESKYRPFFNHDEYLERQANIGLVKRDINPFELSMDRNAELRHYSFPQNTLFRFLTPATLAGYKGAARLGQLGKGVANVRNFMRETIDSSETRGSTLITGTTQLGKMAAEKASGYAYQKFRVGFSKAIRHCQRCGAPTPEGLACRSCGQKMSCPDCGAIVRAGEHHSCLHGRSPDHYRDRYTMGDAQRREEDRRIEEQRKRREYEERKRRERLE